mgnify:CR=1 FL=1
MTKNKKQLENWLGLIRKKRASLIIKGVIKIVLTGSIIRQDSPILITCWGRIQILLKHHDTLRVRKKQIQTKNNKKKSKSKFSKKWARKITRIITINTYRIITIKKTWT